MTQFQKFQRYSSIIPFFSTIFVFIVTMVQLKRKRASVKSWVLFSLIFFLSGIIIYFLNTVIMTGLHPILNMIASGLLLTIANILCVELQLKCDEAEKKPDNHLPKVAILIVGIILLCVTVIGIAMVVTRLLSPSIDIEDINGDDTSLAVLTLDELLSTKDHCAVFGMKYKTDGNQSMVGKDLEEVDYDTCSYRFKKISGRMTLQATKVDSDTLTLDVSSTLLSGNAEIIVLVDGEYYTHAEVGQEQELVLDQVAGKLVVVKLGAESAEISVSVSRTIS